MAKCQSTLIVITKTLRIRLSAAGLNYPLTYTILPTLPKFAASRIRLGHRGTRPYFLQLLH